MKHCPLCGHSWPGLAALIMRWQPTRNEKQVETPVASGTKIQKHTEERSRFGTTRWVRADGYLVRDPAGRRSFYLEADAISIFPES